MPAVKMNKILARSSEIEEAYHARFGEWLKLLVTETPEQHAGLLAAAEMAIARGRGLTIRESFEAMGLKYRPGVDY